MLQNANAKLLLDQKVQGNDNENIDTTSTVLDWLKTDIVNLDCE